MWRMTRSLENERRGRNAPVRQVDAVFLVEVFLPQNCPAGGVKDVQPAGRAEGVGFAIVNGDRGPRAGRIVDLAIGAFVLIRPQRLARFFIEAMNSLARCRDA